MDHSIKKGIHEVTRRRTYRSINIWKQRGKTLSRKASRKKESRGAVPIGGTKKHQKPFFRKNVARILAEARWRVGFPRE